MGRPQPKKPAPLKTCAKAEKFTAVEKFMKGEASPPSKRAKKVQTRPLLDLLVQQFSSKSREELYALVVCGKVYVADELCKNPKQRIAKDQPLRIQEEKPYVSRGGEKLAHALEVWNIAVEGRIWIDAGASTGGFTDALLRKGALQVYAVDVGYNQLDYRLRQDNRVVVMERTNAMHLNPLSPEPHGVVADLSFRSLRGVAKHLLSLTRDREGIFLLKPQFEIEKVQSSGIEAAASNVFDASTPSHIAQVDFTASTDSFSGVITDPKVVQQVFDATVQRLQNEGVQVVKSIESPILGRKGNREFLLYCQLID